MTAPLVRLGFGDLVVTYGAPMAPGQQPVLVLARPAPGEDTTPRRVDLSDARLDERRADWKDQLERAHLVIEADPVRGFDALLECVDEAAATTRPDAGPRSRADLVVALRTIRELCGLTDADGAIDAERVVAVAANCPAPFGAALCDALEARTKGEDFVWLDNVAEAVIAAALREARP